MPRLLDELDYPDIEPHQYRLWCDECRRKTLFRYDQFDLPQCLEHTEEEVQNA